MRALRAWALTLLLPPMLGAQTPSPTKDGGFQLATNPPMQRVHTPAPPPPAPAETFEIREGFTLISTLDEFRAAIKRDGQRIRMKPGVYRATKLDPPQKILLRHAAPDADGNPRYAEQQHIFAVNGSDNHFDLRGVVIETPVSLQSQLTGKAHVADCWHINGSGNTLEGAYFRNIIDRPYPDYRVAENEFEVCNDNTTFLDCTFDIRGSVPYGYTDFYGKGGPNFGRLNKHSALAIVHANNTRIIGCRFHQQSFGHCIHFHTVDGVLITNCVLEGTLRPTNDIFHETAGRAVEYDFHIMYRGKRPIPRGEMIPLTEDGIRSYENVRNITVIDTTVSRMRGCFQLLCTGDITLENVTVREAGDFSFDLSAGSAGKVVMKNCRSDLAYNPIFNLTRGDLPQGATYELTLLDPAEGVQPTPRTSIGTICGIGCTFTLHDGTTRPLPERYNRLICGGKKKLENSRIVNHSRARLILMKNVRNCTVESLGPVEDNGRDNRIIQLER